MQWWTPIRCGDGDARKEPSWIAHNRMNHAVWREPGGTAGKGNDMTESEIQTISLITAVVGATIVTIWQAIKPKPRQEEEGTAAHSEHGSAEKERD